jgi:hypothetical protein
MTGAASTWFIWNSDSTTASTSTTITNGSTWNMWCSGTDATTTDSTSVWSTWNGSVVYRVRQHNPVETGEQIQARLQREEQARIADEERRRMEAEAMQRSEDLLMLQLSEKQKQDWRTQKAFEVLAQSGKRFRIRDGVSMNVDEYDTQGKIVAKHCIIPMERVPRYDQFVMQKLMLEHAESEFMQIANHRVN